MPRIGTQSLSVVRRTGSTGNAAIVLILILLIYRFVNAGAWGSFQISATANGGAALAIAAVGETLIVLSGGFDLSVGSILSLVNVIIATRMGQSAGSEALVTVLVIGVGAGAGLLNGIIIGLARVPSIIATLATSFIWTGIALLVLGSPGGQVPADFAMRYTQDLWNVVPASFLLVLLAILLWLILKRTRLGTAIYAIGSNKAGAEASGINVSRTLVLTYLWSGIFYAIAAVFLSAETGSGDPNLGAPLTLSVFTAVVVGGTVLGGGYGGGVGSVIGAFILISIENLLFSLGVSSFYGEIFTGVLLVVAVIAGSLRQYSSLNQVMRRLRTQLRVAYANDE